MVNCMPKVCMALHGTIHRPSHRDELGVLSKPVRRLARASAMAARSASIVARV